MPSTLATITGAKFATTCRTSPHSEGESPWRRALAGKCGGDNASHQRQSGCKAAPHPGAVHHEDGSGLRSRRSGRQGMVLRADSAEALSPYP